MNREEENDTISISWSIQDVYYQAKNDEVEITREQALNVLHELKSCHDATIGINWDLISSYISQELEINK